MQGPNIQTHGAIKSGSDESPQTILLVDDRQENLVALVGLLETPDAVVLTASSGQEALALLLRHEVALVLLDVQMPGMDGFEVAQLMQGRAKTRNIPIIFMTAYYRDEAALLRGYRNGAIDYLYKPVNPEILKSKVGVFLELDRQKRDLRRAYRDMANQQDYYQSILQAVGDAVIGIDGDGIVRFCNNAALSLFGALHEDFIGSSIFERLAAGSDAEHGRGEFWRKALARGGEFRVDDTSFQRFDGTAFPVSCTCSPVSGQLVGTVMVLRDISERKRFEERLIEQALTDPLTGLSNRLGLKNSIDSAISRAGRGHVEAALLIIDLDHFKDINDTYGHEIGDRLLEQVAERLRQCVRLSDTVARLGGDEFTVMLDNIAHPEDAGTIAEKILSVLATPFQINGVEIAVGASIGIAIYPSCGGDSVELLRAADVAMYRAKNEGRNSYQFFTEEMNAKVRARMMLEQSLRQAIENQQFSCYFQPIVDLENRRPVGFETLLRWQHPEAGFVSPDTFIPLLEDCGLMVSVGSWVLSEVCAYLGNWHALELLPGTFSVAVNISPRQFAHSGFEQEIADKIQSWRLCARRLELEITESLLMRDTAQASALLRRLRDMGLSISVDDFGTGYSSLNYLKHFAIDRLKIDKSFVRNIIEDEKDRAICCTIINLAHNLGLRVIAEGIETEAQAQMLQSFGCDFGQGYWFARPMPLVDAEAYLRAHR